MATSKIAKAVKKAGKRSHNKNRIARYAKSNGLRLPHGYEVVIRKKTKRKGGKKR